MAAKNKTAAAENKAKTATATSTKEALTKKRRYAKPQAPHADSKNFTLHTSHSKLHFQR